MSYCEDSNINKSYIVQNVESSDIFSACTEIYLTNIVPCTGDTIDINSNLNVTGDISGTTFYGDGSQLSGIITTDNYVTGGVYTASTKSLYFTGTTGFTPFSIDVSAVYTADATDFGDALTGNGSQVDGMGNKTRALFMGSAPASANIDYLTFSTKGNAADFGNLTVSRFNMGGAVSNDTRGIFVPGFTPSLNNVLDYITIASAGDAADFGDLSSSRGQLPGTQSTTRGIFIGGKAPDNSNVIDYVTIGSTGNASDFGDLSTATGRPGAISSSTRGVAAGGQQSSADTVTIEYVTISSTGNATDFGDLTLARRCDGNGVGSQIRGVFMGGYAASPGVYVDTIDYITIASTGDAADFGDMVAIKAETSGVSNGHGGLS